MDKITAPFRQSRLLNIVYLSTIFLSFHYYLIVYINSTFLSNFFNEGQISGLYIIGSIINIIVLLNISKVLNKIGNYKTSLYAIGFELLATLGLIFSASPLWTGLYFVLHLTCVPLILFNLDVFLESVAKDENHTGEIRGIYLTLSNITLVVAPALVALFLSGNNYWRIYVLSFLFLTPLYYYVRKYLKDVSHLPLQHIRIGETIAEYIKDKDIYNVVVCHFLLQFFYAYMIVYTPLYLNKYIGFSWSELGVMFTIMLLPFILFELPVGDMADQKYGEKEFLTIGIIIMGIATMFVSFFTIKNFILWTTILFVTRIGASLVEITSESYFFKHVDKSKTDVISFFRITRPLSFVVAPIVATLSLQFMPFQYTFIVIGICILVGVRYSLALKDTK